MTINYTFNVRFSKEDIENFVNREIKEPNDTCMKIAYFENFGNDDTYNFNIFTINDGRIVKNELVSIIDWIRNRYFSALDVEIWVDKLTNEFGTEKFEINITDFYEEDIEYIAKFSNDFCNDSDDSSETKDINDLNDCVEVGGEY